MGNSEFQFRSKVRVAISGVCNLKCKYCDNSHTSPENRVIAMEDFRRTPFREGCITSEDYLKILESFYKNGFRKVNFTGGEPMTNRNWAYLVDETKKLGFESVEMTTNGTLLLDYLNKNEKFPESLDRLIVSIDTYDPVQYKETVGKNYELKDIIAGVSLLKERNPKLKLTANCVLCKSNKNSLSQFISFIGDSGFDTITFLDLVVRDNRDKNGIDFFVKEFLSGKEIKETIKQLYGELTVYGGRHDYNVVLPNGLGISVVDTQGLTRRDSSCKKCSQFCQEGFYTAKVATDGTIIDCLGAGSISIDSIKAINEGKLDDEIKRIYSRLENGELGYHFDEFCNRLGI